MSRVARDAGPQALCALLLSFAAGAASANSGGITGQSTAGCTSCHGTTFNYTASINGGANTVAPDSATNFTVQMNGAGAAAGGFNMSVIDNGSLSDVADAGTDLVGGELVHNTPRLGATPSWTTRFNAGGSVGTATLRVCVNPVNNNGVNDAGDGSSNAGACTTRDITVNRTPTANNDGFVVAEDSGLSAVLDLRDNDFTGSPNVNDGGDSINIDRINGSTAGTVATTNGTVTRSGNTVRYTPDANFNGSDSFTYRIIDSIGAVDTATVTMTVTAVNDAPVAVNDARAATEDQTATYTDLTNNDTDVDGDDLFVHAVTQGSQGASVSIVSGDVQYVPAANFCGTETFTYRVRDRASAGTVDVLLSNFATVTVNVACVPDDPVATADSFSVPRGSDGNALNVLANDSDADNLGGPANAGLTVTVVSVTSPALEGEAAVVTAAGAGVSYTPPPDFSGTRLLSYTITDPTARTATAQITVTVLAGSPPVAVADGPFTVVEDSLASDVTNSFNVLANDSDPDGDTLSIDVTQVPANGVLDGDGGTLLTYQPDADFAGNDSFRYRAVDSAGLPSNEITVSIVVTPVDDPPVAVSDSFPVPPLVFREDEGPFALDVLANDFDVDDGDTLTVQSVTATAGGTVTLVGSGANNTLSYAPAQDFNGVKTFDYTVVDSTGLTDSATVTVTVLPVNDAPIIVSTAPAVADDAQPYSYQLVQTDVDDTQFSYALSGAPTSGTAMTISDSGLITWTPPISPSLAPYTVGPITVTVTDSGGSELPQRLLSATQTFSITVNAPDTDGDGMPDSYELANGFDPEDPADGAQDRDGDGRSNADEYRGGFDPDVDDVAPVLSVPAALQVDSTGFLTSVDLGVASASDVKDGALAVQGPTPAGPYRPGRYSLGYSARDAAGNDIGATQQLDVRPRVELGPDQVSGEGREVIVEVRLNGDAPVYPVLVNYTVGGTADSSDHDAASGQLSIASGTTASIRINIAADGAGETDETIVLTLTSASGAVLGTRTTQTTTIVERNLAPVATLAISQMGEPRAQIFANQGVVTVGALAFDPNAGDTISFDFSASDAALAAPAGNVDSFSFDPAALAPGAYAVRLTVRDAAGAASTAESIVLLQAAAPALGGGDADGDGIADSIEGFADSDGDGVPDYLDRFDETFVLGDQGGAPPATRLLEAESGVRLRLGGTAIAAGRGGARVTEADVIAFGGGGGPAGNGDDTLENVGGLFDFELSGFAPGASVSVVLPLQAALRPGAVWRKYAPSSGWRDFVSDGANRIASAPSSGGVCPAPASSAYVAGLNALHACVRLTLEDGGPNDADGERNGRIRDPGGAAVPRATEPEPIPAGKSGGGGAFALPAVLVLWMFAALIMVQRRRRAA